MADLEVVWEDDSVALDHSERVMLSWNCFKALPDSTRDDRSKKVFFVFSNSSNNKWGEKSWGEKWKKRISWGEGEKMRRNTLPKHWPNYKTSKGPHPHDRFRRERPVFCQPMHIRHGCMMPSPDWPPSEKMYMSTEYEWMERAPGKDVALMRRVYSINPLIHRAI